MKPYNYIFLFIFSAFILAPPVISMLEIKSDISKISFFQEDNQDEGDTELPVSPHFFIKHNFCSSSGIMGSKKKQILAKGFQNTIDVYLTPVVPPPRLG